MVIGMLLPAIIPFNLLKGAINGIITFLLYKKVSNFLEAGDQCVSKPNAVRQ
jgi:riboflavin transporter FmnP